MHYYARLLRVLGATMILSALLQVSGSEPVVALAVLFFLLGVYLLPTIVASSRHHRQAVAIFLLNLFLGWTFVGWVIALVWSATADVQQRPARD